MTERTRHWLLLLGAVLCFSPLVLSLAAGGIASLLACPLASNQVNPCLMAGMDIGPILYGAFHLGFLTLYGVPAFFLWLLVIGLTFRATHTR